MGNFRQGRLADDPHFPHSPGSGGHPDGAEGGAGDGSGDEGGIRWRDRGGGGAHGTNSTCPLRRRGGAGDAAGGPWRRPRRPSYLPARSSLGPDRSKAWLLPMVQGKDSNGGRRMVPQEKDGVLEKGSDRALKRAASEEPRLGRLLGPTSLLEIEPATKEELLHS